MLALIFVMVFPLLLILIWRAFNREKQPGKGEYILRYLAYALFLLLVVGVLKYVERRTESPKQEVPIQEDSVQEHSVAPTPEAIGEAEEAGLWIVTQYSTRDINSSFYTIHNEERGLIVIDGGWTEDAMAVEDIIKSLGGEVDAWILTHPHQDHIGAFNEIYPELRKNDFREIQIEEIYTVDMASPEECLAVASWDSVDAYNDFLALEIPDLNYVYPGDELNICGLEVDIYNAYDENVQELSSDYLNDGSMMFEVSAKEDSFLFCADVGNAMSDFLLEKWGQELQADYLQMGHHGYGGLDDDFYEMVAPSVAFFDAPDWLMYDTTGKYDNPEHIALMERMGSEVVSFNSAPNFVILE